MSINFDAFGGGVRDSDAWPTTFYIATKNAGVYYTSNFTGPGGTDPTYTPVNGYAGGDLSDDWRCFEIMGDKDFPDSHQYLMIEPKTVEVGLQNEYRRLLYRDGSGEWQDWLNNEQAAAILGFNDVRIQLFYADKATGYINVICRRGAPDTGAGPVAFLQATSPFGDFEEYTALNIADQAWAFDSFITHGTRWMFSLVDSVASRSRMYYSTNSGRNWAEETNEGGAGIPRASFKYDTNTPDIAYFDRGIRNEVAEFDLTTGDQAALENSELGSIRVDSMYFSPDDFTKQRSCDGNSLSMYTTLTRWTDFSTDIWDPLEISGIYWGPSGYTNNLVLIARDDVIEIQPNTVYVWDGINLEGKSGPDPITGANSIPIDGNGAAENYAILMVSGFPVCTPMTAIEITPPASDHICTNLTYTAEVTPATATTPITYTWSMDSLVSGQGTAEAVYNFTETCDKTITVSATNACTLTPVTDSVGAELTLALSQIADAIQDTLEANMSASLLSRMYDWDELPEGINDAPSLMVYWQSALADALTDTDRYTFSGVRNKELLFHADYFTSTRNNLQENNATLTRAMTEIIDILETESAAACSGDAQCPPFGLCALKTFNWNCERVIFDYGGVLLYGARCEIRFRLF